MTNKLKEIKKLKKAAKSGKSKKVQKVSKESINYEEKCIELLKKYTGKKNVRLTERGNFAIFAALHLARKINDNATLLVPDQGGWISFETYPKMMNFFVEKVKTNYGLIDLNDLQEKLRLQNASALIMTSLAGYFAEQDVQKIHEICREKNCLLIEDATGIISKKTYGDIVVGSFGDWKPVNLGYGGFIASDFAINQLDIIWSLSKVNFDYEELFEKLKNSAKRIKKLENKCESVKKDLNGFEILLPEKNGLNVVVKILDERDKRKIIEYCDKKKFEYVLCPKNIRVIENAISIEIKRIE